MKEVMIRVPYELVEDLKKKYKELETEDNATVVRIALRKLLNAEVTEGVR